MRDSERGNKLKRKKRMKYKQEEISEDYGLKQRRRDKNANRDKAIFWKRSKCEPLRNIER